MRLPPAVFVTASAIGYYGDRGDTVLTESDDSGQGFLADVARGWEAAAAPATEHGVRHAAMRFGVILSPRGGALPKMLTPTRFVQAPSSGTVQAFMSWITLDDAVAAIVTALFDSRLSGPVNVTAPEPVRSGDFARTLGRVVSRPVFIRVPAFALRALLGEMADEMLLASLRVEPTRLKATGFEFRDPQLARRWRRCLGVARRRRDRESGPAITPIVPSPNPKCPRSPSSSIPTPPSHIPASPHPRIPAWPIDSRSRSENGRG